MSRVFASHEAKARFSEVLRKVRAGETIVVTYHGEEVAKIIPVVRSGDGLEDRLARLEDLGRLPAARAKGERPRISELARAKRPGALARFLEERHRD